ncbi:ComEC/Rec2 family competence protein [Pedobacter sp. GR22-6]|uniref:ComEC/Rec2 family competence protein n=1 Tax=Pedobacter sp. GR22-6 TaxID=3127957 RepID=UPI00307F8677
MNDSARETHRRAAPIVFTQLLICYISGILLAYPYRDLCNCKFLTITFFCLFQLLILINLVYKKRFILLLKGFIKPLFFLLSILGGILCCVLHDERLASDYYLLKPSTYLKVRVTEEPRLKNGILNFKAAVVHSYFLNSEAAVSGQLFVSVKRSQQNPIELEYGQELFLPAKSNSISPTLNPAEFDYRSWLAAQNIYQQTFVKQNEILKLNYLSGNKLIAAALALRLAQINYLRKLMKDSTTFSVASTLILGYRIDLDAEVLSTYSKTGTIHALSVSGMHVGLIYLVINWLLRFMERKKWLRFLKFAIIILLIWGYALLSGLSPSVMRAVIMLSTVVLSNAFSKNNNGYNGLAFAAFCLLLYDPYMIWDVGFQLSFTAVIGLIWLQPKIQNCWQPKHKGLLKLWESLAMSLAAQLSTFPLSTYYFHQFPTYFLFSNLFILLPSALIMYLGMIILLFRLDFLIPIFENLIQFMNMGLSWISRLPAASLSGIWINKSELILLSFTIAIFVFAFRKNGKLYLFLGLTCAILLQLSFCRTEFQRKHQKKIIAFSLSRHYATAFISGGEAIVLTDVDARHSHFIRHVKPTLDSLQVNKFYFLNREKNFSRANFSMQDQKIIFFQYCLNSAEFCSPLNPNSKAVEIDLG